MFSGLGKELTIVLTIKLIVLFMIWRIFFYEQAPVIAPLQNLLP